jgi:hydrogenase-4 component B
LTSDPGALLAGAFGVPALALIGALALACFVKVFGAVFLGTPRSAHPAHASEPGTAMTWPMFALGALCLAIGVGPVFIIPILSHATATWAPELAVVSLSEVAPLQWLSVTGLGLIVVVGLGAFLFARASRTKAEQTTPGGEPVATQGPLTWDCGYAAPTSRMQYTASSFAEMLVGLLAWALRPREHTARVRMLFPTATRYHGEVPDVVLDRGVLPAAQQVGRALVWFRWIQHGHIHLYLVYILAALILAILVLR